MRGMSAAPPDTPNPLRAFIGVFRYSRRALELVWTTSRPLTVALGILTLLAGAVPAAVAWVGAQIVDAVVAAIAAGGIDGTLVVEFVVLEGVLVAVIAVGQAMLIFGRMMNALLASPEPEGESEPPIVILDREVTLPRRRRKQP